MNRKISLGTALAYMAIVAAITFVFTMLYSTATFNRTIVDLGQREAYYSAISELDQYIRQRYYGEIDPTVLSNKTLAGYMGGLGDPYARFLTPKEYETYARGETRYSGIGVSTEQSPDGYLRILEVYPQSPAEAAGLKAGDLIISIDGAVTNAAGATYDEMVGRLRGDAGTKVTIVKREGTDEFPPVEITRRIIDVPTVRSQVMDNVAYIRVSGISTATPAQLERMIKQLQAEGVGGLIFDVRGLSSDNLRLVAEMLDILLPRLPIIYTTGNSGQAEVWYSSDEADLELPMAVLIDATTTGAPEMFAMALRDCGKAKTVGESTFGKGTLQEVQKLRNGSAVIFTTAVISGPAGETYNLVGVPADFEVKLGVDDENKSNVLGSYDLDPQYRKAQELVLTAMRGAAAAR